MTKENPSMKHLGEQRRSQKKKSPLIMKSKEGLMQKHLIWVMKRIEEGIMVGTGGEIGAIEEDLIIRGDLTDIGLMNINKNNNNVIRIIE